jgi:hypothetical protein
MACAIGEVHMLAACLNDPHGVGAAAQISLTRGNGRVCDEATIKRDHALGYGECTSDARAAADVQTGAAAWASSKTPRAGESAEAQAYREKVARGRFQQCAIFHGAASDGSQLAHIFNVLGTPTESDIRNLRLLPVCELQLRNLVRTVVAQSKGLPLPRWPSRRPYEHEVVAQIQQLRVRHPMATDDALRKHVMGLPENRREMPYCSRIQKDYELELYRGFKARGLARPLKTPRTLSSAAGEDEAEEDEDMCRDEVIDIDAHGLPAMDLEAYLSGKGIPAYVGALLSGMLRWDPDARLRPAAALELPLLGSVFVPDAAFAAEAASAMTPT